MKGRRYRSASFIGSMLLRRRSSYRLLFLAVLLSTFLAGATVLMISTGRASFYELNFTRYGEEDFIVHNADPAFLQSLADNGIIRNDYGTVSIYGFALPDGKSTENGFSVAAMDANAERLAHRRLREGRLPEKPGEIAIERIALKKAKLQAEVGDSLSLSVQLPDGEGGFLSEPVQMDFALVGILEDQHPYIRENWGWGDPKPVYQDIPTALVDPAEPMPAGSAFVFNGLVDLARNTDPERIPSEFYDALADWKNKSDQDTEYTKIMVKEGGIANYEYSLLETTAVISFAMGTLLLLCAMGIVASFSVTIEERTHQLALLRAVGATRGQLLRTMLSQSLTLTLIAIPFGFALSVAAVYGIVKMLGGSFRFVWDGWAICAAVAAMFLTVLIASLIPAWKALRITPMQAIRDVDMQYAMRRDKARSSRHFRPASHLALRNLALHKGGWGSALVLTLIAVLIVTTVIPFAVHSIRNTVQQNKCADYTLWTWSDAIGVFDGINQEYPYKLLTEEDIGKVQSVFQDQKAEFVTRRQIQTVLHLDEITDYLKFAYSPIYQRLGTTPNDIARDVYRLRHFEGEEKEQFISWIETYNNLSFIRFPEGSILEGEIHPDKIASGEEIIIYAPFWATDYDAMGNGRSNYGSLEMIMQDGYTNIHGNDTFHAGDELTFSLLSMPKMLEGNSMTGYEDEDLDLITQKVQTVKIGAVVSHSESPGFNLGNLYKILTTDSALDAWGWEKPDPDSVYISLSDRPPEELEQYYDYCLEEIISVIDRGQYRNSIENADLSRDNNRAVILIASGIALIFFAATAFLVNRTLSAQVRSHTRTIGMLRAVGADRGSIARMYGLQVIIVILLGSVIAFILGIILSQIQQYVDLPLKEILPIAAVLVPVYVAVLIGLCMCQVHACIGTIYRRSISENIHEL